MALACFLGTAIPACSPNHTGTIPVIVTSPSPSSSPVNGTWQEGILPKRVDAISGNESTNAGFGSHTGSGGNPNYQTAISGGSTIGAGATTDCSLATSTATFGKTSGESTPCPKSTSAGNPWGPSNASPSPSASPVNSVGTGTTVVIGGGSANTGSPTPTPTPSVSVSVVFETGGFGVITGNLTTVDKISAGNPWGPSNSSPSPSPSASPVNGTWQEGILPKRVDETSGGNPNYQTVTSGGSTIGAVATTDCSLATSTATFGKTSGSQQIDVKATPCPKSTSAG